MFNIIIFIIKNMEHKTSFKNSPYIYAFLYLRVHIKISFSSQA